jgi:hypothetical protein
VYIDWVLSWIGFIGRWCSGLGACLPCWLKAVGSFWCCHFLDFDFPASGNFPLDIDVDVKRGFYSLDRGTVGDTINGNTLVLDDCCVFQGRGGCSQSLLSEKRAS